MTNVITAAGTTFAISAGLPASHDAVGFAALTFTPIGELVDGGSAGKSFNKVPHSPLSEREVLDLKGSYTQGTRSIALGHDLADAGQVLMQTALDSDSPYSFSITFQNGEIHYSLGTIDSGTIDIGTIDSIVGTTASIAQRGDVVKVAAP